MKTIAEQLSLKGKLEEITMTDLRTRPGEVIDQVNLGKVFVIKKAGKSIGVLSKVPGQCLAIKVNPNGMVEYEKES